MGCTVKKSLLLICSFVGLVLATSCTYTDQSKYDIKSPCVSNSSSGMLDQPCERRLPIENIQQSGILASS
jgi:hypothetical protein